ncbi:hypothetical protein HEP87_62515 [Streptomyces sp. S1D4-11]
MADELDILRRANPVPSTDPRFHDRPSTSTRSAASANCCTADAAARAPVRCAVGSGASAPRPPSVSSS